MTPSQFEQAKQQLEAYRKLTDRKQQLVDAASGSYSVVIQIKDGVVHLMCGKVENATTLRLHSDDYEHISRELFEQWNLMLKRRIAAIDDDLKSMYVDTREIAQ